MASASALSCSVFAVLLHTRHLLLGILYFVFSLAVTPGRLWKWNQVQKLLTGDSGVGSLHPWICLSVLPLSSSYCDLSSVRVQVKAPLFLSSLFSFFLDSAKKRKRQGENRRFFKLTEEGEEKILKVRHTLKLRNWDCMCKWWSKSFNALLSVFCFPFYTWFTLFFRLYSYA